MAGQADQRWELLVGGRQQLGLSLAPGPRRRCSRGRCAAAGARALRAQAAPATAAQPGPAAEAAPLDGKLKIIGAQQQAASCASFIEPFAVSAHGGYGAVATKRAIEAICRSCIGEGFACAGEHNCERAMV